ncbi:MAG: hypothetical protein IPG08_14660 [Sphingobacteriaceae bacterium]|nr:hypothetical protein [Sphingobacteriaceae bacterium]
MLLSSKELTPEDSEFLRSENITFQLEKNEGFDFGLWYKAFQTINVAEYDQIALVNDSCVLFRTLDPFMAWASKDNADVKGITYSEAITPHIQSYFMILNKKAIDLTASYFKEHKLKTDISEVIITYEIGLNKYFTDKDLNSPRL